MRKQTEALKLAADLLEDVELDRLEAEKLLLKSLRLARLAGDETSLTWLQLELSGYQFTNENRPHLRRSARIYKDKDGKEKAKVASFGSIDANIRALEGMLKTMQTPSLSSEHLTTALNAQYRNIGQVTVNITELAAIRAAVIAGLYEFATRTYHELAFSESQADLFDTAQREIDALLAPLSGHALSKIEAILDRLSAEDAEAISQAMNTCRRLIDSFADAIYPARDEPIMVGDQRIEVKKSHVLNRIEAYVRTHTDSRSRQTRLRQSMRGIYDRVSTGVHSDVSYSEARFLFLQTYVTIGEILLLDRKSIDVVE